MDSHDALTTLAEIAIAIAGFSGIAAVLGRRNQGEWSPSDVVRLRSLLVVSFTIVIFCFFPIILSLAVADSEKVWAVSSGAWIVQSVVAILFGVRDARQVVRTTGEALDRKFVGLVALLFVGLEVLQAANVLVVRDAWPYLSALVAHLVFPFAMFLRLLRRVLGPRGAA